MGEKIKIGEIKQALKNNKELVEIDLSTGKESEWPLYDSGVSDMGRTFCSCLPEDYQNRGLGADALRKYIEDIFSKEKKERGDLTAVEFGGPGSNLFQGFGGLFKRTVGVCLEDIRFEIEKKFDEDNRHSVIAGDILDTKNDALLTQVLETLGVRKINLIICRMEGPLTYIDMKGAILDRIFRNWYRILAENGLMFIQFSPFWGETNMNDDLIEKWVKKAKKEIPELDVSVNMGEGTLRIHKQPGSPEEFPTATQLFKEAEK